MNRDVLATVVSRFLLVGLGLAVTVFTSRCLDPAARGDYAVMISLANLVVQFGSLGLASTGTYQLAGNRSVFPSLSSNCVWISLVWGGTVAVCFAAANQFFAIWPDMPASYAWIGGMLGVPLMFVMLGSNLLVGLERITLYNALQVFNGVAVISALVIAWLLGGTVGIFLTASAVAASVSALVLWVVLVRLGASFQAFDWGKLKSGMRFSAKTYVICLLGYLIMRLNLFAVERWSAPQEAGYLSLAIQGADILLIIPISLGMVLFPRLVRSEADRWRTTLRVLSVTATAMALVCLITSLTAAPLIQGLFGERYLPSADVLNWMLPGVFASSLLAVVSQYLAATGIPRSQVVIWFIGLFVCAIALVLCVPSYGAIGGALAYSVSMSTVCVLACSIAISQQRRREPVASPQELRQAA